jgi:MoaA/NifB/PqqE/SkfB family radical SAM enzyme
VATSLGADRTYVLARDCRYRREAFGASLFDARTHTVRFFDHGGAVCLEAFFNPVEINSAKTALEEFFADTVALERYVDALIEADILRCSEESHPPSYRFYIDQTEFHSSHLVAPLALEFELTLRCRRSCSYCAYDSHPAVSGKGELNLDQYRAAFESARNAGVFYLRFTGGDPLLREDALQVITMADEMGFSVAVASDLTMLSERQTCELAALNRLTVLQTTIDGPDAASADHLRGNGNYRAVLAGISKLRAAGVPVMVGTVLTKFNKARIYEIAELLSQFDVSYCVSPLYSAGRGKDLVELIPSDDDLVEAYEQFAKAVERRLVRPADPGWNAIARDARPSHREMLWKSQPWLIRSPDRVLRVDPYGRCYAGVQAKELLSDEVYVGSIMSGSIEQIWNQSPALNSLRQSAEANLYYGNVIDSRTLGSRRP